MSYRTAAWLAWSLWVLTVALQSLSMLLNMFIPSISISEAMGLTNIPETVAAVLLTTLVLSFSTVGALIATRRPHNPIGWIMLAAGISVGATLLASAYVDLSLALPQESLPATQWVAWVTSWLPLVGFAPMVTFLLLLFPDGRLPSRRWRPVGWLAVVAVATLALGTALTPGSLVYRAEVINPLGLAPIEGSLLEEGGVGWLLVPVSVVLSAASMVVRFRRAAGEQRQQIKWLALAAVFAAVGWVFSSLTYETKLEAAGILLVLFSFLGIPLAVGIAVLKYRLYEVDLLINRTLVYGSLTATLVALYFGAVVLLQRIFVTLTGQQSTLAVVASTLLIAALSNPLRRRVQAFVDRRFYRSKYDTRKTLEAFSARLRDETDLDALSDDLVGVVRETTQPAHVSLWLRPEPSLRTTEGSE